MAQEQDRPSDHHQKGGDSAEDHAVRTGVRRIGSGILGFFFAVLIALLNE